MDIRWYSRLSVAIIVFCAFGWSSSTAQDIEVSGGGGWAPPTNNVEATAASGGDPLGIDLKPGPHVYGGVGIVRPLGKQFALGARLRAQVSHLRSRVGACSDGGCNSPEGRLRAATLEGRIILRRPDWIHPYLLVGLGVVNATVDGVTVDGTSYERVSVTDAGGDIGLGASIPIVKRLFLDTEFRVTGTLPGAKENAVTKLPFAVGLSYRFE